MWLYATCGQTGAMYFFVLSFYVSQFNKFSSMNMHFIMKTSEIAFVKIKY